MKIVVNRCYGGFSVSKAVFDELGFEWDGYGFLSNKDFGIENYRYLAWRTNATLIAAIEKIGVGKASGELSALEVVNVPSGISWEIDEYDGWEKIAETHRSW